MMPIGAYDPRWFMRIVHMDPDEAVEAYQQLISAHPGTACRSCLPGITGDISG
jgi:hypothetical protein